MKTLTQLIGLVVPPGKQTVEFKVIFAKEDYDKARDILIEKGYPLWDSLSADTPVSDRLEDIYMLMKALEVTDGAKEHEWKQDFFKQWTPEETRAELERLYRCVVYDRIDDVDRQELWMREVGIVLQKLMRDDLRQLDDAKLMLAAIARNWLQERQNIFARNAHRKTTRVAMEEYLMREGQFGNESTEQNHQEGQETSNAGGADSQDAPGRGEQRG